MLLGLLIGGLVIVLLLLLGLLGLAQQRYGPR